METILFCFMQTYEKSTFLFEAAAGFALAQSCLFYSYTLLYSLFLFIVLYVIFGILIFMEIWIVNEESGLYSEDSLSVISISDICHIYIYICIYVS